jgi:hypothetical protein
VDSLLDVYEENEKVYKSVIMLAFIDIEKLQKLSQNMAYQVEALKSIVKNQNTIIQNQVEVIDNLNKKVRKQKRLKWIGFGATALLTILLII